MIASNLIGIMQKNVFRSDVVSLFYSTMFSTSFGGGGANFASSSTSTKFVNGKRVTTKT